MLRIASNLINLAYFCVKDDYVPVALSQGRISFVNKIQQNIQEVEVMLSAVKLCRYSLAPPCGPAQ